MLFLPNSQKNSMITIEKALEIISDDLPKRITKRRLVEEAIGLRTSESIKTKLDSPRFDNSAMDGYVVSELSENLAYKCVGEIKAGDSPELNILKGECYRIFTGAPVPSNAYAVVQQELADVENENVTFTESFNEGKNIRRKGEELSVNDILLNADSLITPATIGLLHSQGITKCKVYDLPKVAVVATGNELITPGEELQGGQIYESNSSMLQSVLKFWGINRIQKYKIHDSEVETTALVGRLLQDHDLIIFSGGISVGDYDFVGKSLKNNHVEERFYKVNQKPGKPIWYGAKGHRKVFALPGNPAAALTCAYVYIKPLIDFYITGCFTGQVLQSGILRSAQAPVNSRNQWLKAFVEGNEISILDGQSSSMLSSFAQSNALAFLPSNKVLSKGDQIEYFKL